MSDPVAGVFATERIALATHRPTLRAELAGQAERLRIAHVEGLTTVLRSHAGHTKRMPPEAAALLMVSVPGMLLMEQAAGISAGHAETLDVVERYLREVEGDPPARRGPAGLERI